MRAKNLIALIISFLILMNIATAEEFYVSNHLHSGGIIDTDIVSSQDSFYEYEMIGIYDAYFNDNPTQAQVVKFILSGTEITFQPMALNWRNDISQLQQINMVQGVIGTPTNNAFIYDNAYGSGIDLTYVTEDTKIKERLWINSFSDLTSPQQYIIDGGNAYLELNFIIGTNAQHIEIDGVDWDKNSDESTTNEVYIKDDNGKTLYYLPKPIAVDNNGDTIYLTYRFKKSGSSLYISIGTPYSWLVNASYPVMIDPTFTVDYSPVPAQRLINGLVKIEDDIDFTTINDITSGVSDDDDATNYSTQEHQFTEGETAFRVFKFEETSGNTSKDEANGVIIQLYGNPILNVGGADGSGIDFDGNNDYGIIPINFTANENESYGGCIAILDEGISGLETIIDTKAGGTAEGVEYRLTSSDYPQFFVRRGSTQTTLTGSTALDDSSFHRVCGFSLANGSVYLYVDAILEDSATGVTGGLISTINTHLAEDHTGGGRYSQKLDEMCFWRTGNTLNHLGITLEYNTSYCGNIDGIAMNGKWNKTYNPSYNWYLRVKKIVAGTDLITIYPYINNTEINTTYYKEENLTGTGWFNINISDMMNYQTNIIGMNHTSLRFYMEQSTEISEVRLRAEANDTSNPEINDCWTNNASIGCDGTAKWVCNITDDVDVNNVDFTINGVNYTAIKNDTQWYYSITFIDVGTIIENLTLTDVYAYDLLNNLNHTTQNETIEHTCIICIENWVAQLGSCLTNDTQFKTYNDNNTCGTNDTLPADNGTYVFCDYCYEDLQQTLGECNSTNNQTVDYTDDNYGSCCSVTGLVTDCSIDYYPYNETTYQSCDFYQIDFDCTYDSTPVLNNKINVICEMPDNQTYCCLVNIYQDTNLLATTPEYKDATNSFLAIRSEEETRECFTPNQRLLNAYYTKKELRPNTDYLMEVICTTTNGTTIKSQALINPEYHEYDWLPHRLVSIGEKPVLTIITIVVIIFLVLLGIFGIKKIRGR